MGKTSLTISTIGHSMHPIEEFIRILQAHGIRQLIDVRTIPGSRRNPQFNRDTLAVSLKAAGIGYVHMPGLGGLRRARPDSKNTGWRNASFRGFADYMQTAEFRDALEALISVAPESPAAIMCAEAVPWRCHRSLIADALTARGVTVLEIMSASHIQPHTLTPFARVQGEEVTYPGNSAAEKIGGEAVQLKFDAPGRVR